MELSSQGSSIIVSLGSLNCEVFSATSTEIICALEPGPAAVYDITVVVKSKAKDKAPKRKAVSAHAAW